MTKHQKAQQLMKLFDSHYKAKNGADYKGNTHADKWGFVDMVDDLGFERAVDVVTFYFKTKPRSGHTRQHLFYHYHEYSQSIDHYEKEKANKKAILDRMKEEYEG